MCHRHDAESSIRTDSAHYRWGIDFPNPSSFEAAARTPNGGKAERFKVEQISHLRLERDQANNRVASLTDEIGSLKTNSAELLRLRGEVARLRREGRDSDHQIEKPPNVTSQQAEKSDLDRLNQITQWLQRHSSEKTPELKLLSAQDWLKAAEGGLDNEGDYPLAMSRLRMTAEAKGVLPALQAALKQYALANPGQFPQNLSELSVFLNPPLGEEILQRYEIAPVSGLQWAVGPSDVGLGSDWVITQKSPVNAQLVPKCREVRHLRCSSRTPAGAMFHLCR